MQHRLLELLVGGRDDLYLVGDPAQAIYGFNGSDPGAAARRRRPACPASRSSACRRTTAARRRSSAAGVGRAARRRPGRRRATSAAADGPAVRVVGADDEDHEAALVVAARPRPRSRRRARRRRRRAGPHERPAAPARPGARRAPASRSRREQLAPARRWRPPSRPATALPSASRLRAWAHDIARGRSRPADARRRSTTAERRVAAAVLEFLRDQPFGDGAALRTWIATTEPVRRARRRRRRRAPHVPRRQGPGVAHRRRHRRRDRPRAAPLGDDRRGAGRGGPAAARRRHAGQRPARASRGRPAAAATSARPSPLIADIDDAAAPTVAPRRPSCAPCRRPPATRRSTRLGAWRERMARAATILPDELCSDADLRSDRRAPRPTTPAELAAVTALGAADRRRAVLPAIRGALDVADAPRQLDASLSRRGRRSPARGRSAACPCGRCGR